MTTSAHFVHLVQAAAVVLLIFLYANWYDPVFSVEITRKTTNFSSKPPASIQRENTTTTLQATTRLFINSTPFPLLDENICTFPKVDIFDPDIMKHAKRPFVTCQPLEPTTSLVDGILVNRSPDLFNCFGRCLRFETDKKNNYSDWKATESNHTFGCDIVEARCFDIKTGVAWNKTAPYSYIHTQILEKTIPQPEIKPEAQQYSVYFLIVDSQAYTQLYRNMPETLDFLTKNMSAINFPYVNIFTRISRDNGYAWLYGKNTEKIDKKRYGVPNVEADPYWEKTANCKRSADKDYNMSLIMDFSRKGYVTASVEDWYMLLSYGCAEISSHPFDHIYNPYVIEYEKNYQSWHKKFEKQCVPRHRHALVYLSQFTQSYANQPKFVFSWFSHVGHNTAWGTKDLDKDMHDFLSLNHEELDRSFVVFAGDHGLRFTDAANTKVGKLDVINPALLISLPKELRKNEELRRVMEENAKNLQTHFDTRATFLDILKYQPASNFSNYTLMEIEGELGHSQFRKQPGPRTCKHLPIHTHECMCLQSHTVSKNYLTQDSVGSTKIANVVNNLLNMEVQSGNNSDICDRWVFRKLSELTLIHEKPATWQGILLSTSVEKGRNASFKFFLEAVNSTDYHLLSYDRLDLYKNRGDCVNHQSLAKVCDCLSVVTVE